MGVIIDIKRFEIHDGDGIRTSVFLKGCPLKCVWCHNPEGVSPVPQLSYNEFRCINCGECAAVCNVHRFEGSKHIFDRDKCIGRGSCEAVCLGNALKFYGKEMSADELIPVLLEDKPFYDESGGGVTLSGGEPLMQADFCRELLRKLKENGINTNVDTCGFASRDTIDKVLPYTDMFLYDIKAIDEQTHIRCTGQSNRIILDNIRYIDACEKPIEVRIPFIPSMNDNQISAMGEFLSTLRMVRGVKVLPYHNLSITKYESLGMEYPLAGIKIPTDKEIDSEVECLKLYGLNAVNGRK